MKIAEQKIFYVYLYLREANSERGGVGSPFYVGKGRGKRCFQTHGYIRRPKSRDNIKIIAENLTEVDAFQLEIFLIHMHGRIDLGTGCLKNRTIGGDGSVGAIRSQKFKQAVSKHFKGKKLSPEHVEKVRIANTGKKHTPEARAKMSAIKTGKINTPEAMAKTWASNLGRKHSPEWIEKQRRGNLGKKRSNEAKQRISAGKIAKMSADDRSRIASIAAKAGHAKRKLISLTISSSADQLPLPW